MSTSSLSNRKRRPATNLQSNAGAGAVPQIQPIVIYALETCPYCHRALTLLDQAGLKYTKIIVSSNEKEKMKIKKKTGMNTFPMIFIQDEADEKIYHRLGGCDALIAHLRVVEEFQKGDLQMEVVHALLRMK
jgi:glutaredoxin 3